MAAARRQAATLVFPPRGEEDLSLIHKAHRGINYLEAKWQKSLGGREPGDADGA